MTLGRPPNDSQTDLNLYTLFKTEDTDLAAARMRNNICVLFERLRQLLNMQKKNQMHHAKHKAELIYLFPALMLATLKIHNTAECKYRQDSERKRDAARWKKPSRNQFGVYDVWKMRGNNEETLKQRMEGQTQH